MKRTHSTHFKILYGLVVSAGVVILSVAGHRMFHDRISPAWVILSLLTVAAGSLSLKIPGVNGRASVGDSLICLSVFLFGPLPGAMTAALEGIAGSFRCRKTSRSRRFQFVLFNGGAMSVSAYAAGLAFFALTGQPVADPGAAGTASLPGALAAFALIYFATNTLVVAAASALDKSVSVLQTWRDGFLWTGVNYLAATFLSGILAQITDPMSFTTLGPLLTGSAAMYASARARLFWGQSPKFPNAI